jgi:hypothetical protein
MTHRRFAMLLGAWLLSAFCVSAARAGQNAPATILKGTCDKLVRFSADGSLVLTMGEHGSARVWDANTGRPLIEPIPLAGKPVAGSFTAGDAEVFVATDAQIGLYESRTGRAVTRTIASEISRLKRTTRLPGCGAQSGKLKQQFHWPGFVSPHFGSTS